MKQEIIRKLSAAVAMSLVVGVSLAACGGSSSSTAAGVTKTGSAEGFGGAVTATLTVDANGTVTDCKLEGAQETESIGGAALEELSKQVVAANGPAIDGVAGATVTTKAVRKAVAAALGVELAEEAPADSAVAAPAEPAAIVPVEGGIQIGQAYAAAHGTKSDPQIKCKELCPPLGAQLFLFGAPSVSHLLNSSLGEGASLCGKVSLWEEGDIALAMTEGVR